MKLSCLPVSLFSEILSGKMSLEDWLYWAQSIGLDGADFSILFLRQRAPTALQTLRRTIQKVGLPVMMITAYPDLTNPDGITCERELACAIADIAAAAELEIPFFRITAGQYYEGENDLETAKRVAAHFAVCVKWAQRWGVTLLLENHSKPGVWEKPDFVFHTKRFRMLYDLTDGMPIGINFDTANTYALGDDAVSLFRDVYPRVQSIHVNDLREAHTLDFVSPGCGKAPIREIFSEARRRGYEGLFSIEETGNLGLSGIKRSVKRTREMWENT